MKELKIELRLEAYVVVVDKGDYDYVIFFDNELKDLQWYADFIKEKYPNKFDLKILVERYELYVDMEGNLKKFGGCNNFVEGMVCEHMEFDVIDLVGNFKDWFCENAGDIMLKKIDKQEIKMPLNEKNKFEKLADEWDKIKDCLFDYNGAVWYVNEHMLYKMREFLDELENELKS